MRFRRVKLKQKIVKKLLKFACFLEHRFWEDFGRVLGGFGEAKILDFRIFFDVFSKQNLEGILEGTKIEKTCQQDSRMDLFGASPAECAEPGGEIERG